MQLGDRWIVVNQEGKFCLPQQLFRWIELSVRDVVYRSLMRFQPLCLHIELVISNFHLFFQ
jgi:hypothetical protein